MDEQNCKDLPLKGIPQEPDAPANAPATDVAESSEIAEPVVISATTEEPVSAETTEPVEPPEKTEAADESEVTGEAPETTESEPKSTEEEATPEESAPDIPAESPDEPPQSPTPPPYDPQPALDALMAQTQAMAQQLSSLEALFTKRIMYTDHEEKTLDRMHSELQRYKEDLYFKLIKPILVDVLEMRDSIIRMAEMYAAKPEGQQDIPLKTFSNYAYDLQEILEKNGIEIFRSEPGGDYIPLRQRVVKKCPTTDETLHGKVAQSITSGYLNGDKVLSPEKVSVYVYEAPKEG